MKRKILSALLTTAMVCSLFAGCGQQQEVSKESNAGKESTVSSETTGASSEKEKPKEPVLLEWYYNGNGQQADTEAVEAAVNELLKEYPGLEHVSLNLNSFPGSEIPQQVALAQASGAQMDILCSVSLDFYEQVALGSWMPMNDYISEELKNELPDWLWEMGSVDGQIYVVPNYQNAFNMQFLVFPKEYMDKYGNYEEMREILQDPNTTLREKADCLEKYVMAVDAGEGGSKYASNLAENNTTGSLGFGFTTPFDKIINKFIVADGTDEVIHAHEQDYYKEEWAIYADWYDKGIYAPDGLSTVRGNYAGNHMMDPTSMVFYAYQTCDTEENVAKRLSNAFGFDCVAIKSQYYDYIQNTWAAGGNGISSTCEHPEEAAKFLEAITCGSEIGKKIYNTLVFGLEGKHYNVIDAANDRIETLEYRDTQGGIDTSYAGKKWIIGNSFYAYKNQAVTDEYYPTCKAYNESPDTVTSSLIGFVADTTSIKTQLEQITAVENEYQNTLAMGVLGKAGWEAYYNEYMNKLKSAGLDEVKAELQKQLDAFIANK